MTTVVTNPSINEFNDLMTKTWNEYGRLIGPQSNRVRKFPDFAESVWVKNLTNPAPIVCSKNLLFASCPLLGNITAVGTVIMLECYNHGKVTSEGDIHCFNSNCNNLFPKGKLYIYESPNQKATVIGMEEGVI